MIFISILIITTLSIAACAAWFSIYGLAAIFSGIFWPVVIMGTVLEVGKLVAVSYVYRFYDSITAFMKLYLILSIIVLMLITSAGIFGFLSAGYQQDTLPLKQQEQKIMLLIDEKKELTSFKTERMDRKKQIDDDIAALPNNFIKGRQRLLKTYAVELDQLRNDIQLYTKQINGKTLEISDLKQQKLLSQVHVGPIIYIAKVFDTEVDDATKWLILLIIFSFDPLAVALTLGANHALVRRKKQKATDNNDIDISVNDDSIVIEVHDDSVDIETNPVTSMDSQATGDIDDLKKALEEMRNKTLGPAEIAQQSMLEELLARKIVTNRLRNPKNN